MGYSCTARRSAQWQLQHLRPRRCHYPLICCQKVNCFGCCCWMPSLIFYQRIGFLFRIDCSMYDSWSSYRRWLNSLLVTSLSLFSVGYKHSESAHDHCVIETDDVCQAAAINHQKNDWQSDAIQVWSNFPTKHFTSLEIRNMSIFYAPHQELVFGGFCYKNVFLGGTATRMCFGGPTTRFFLCSHNKNYELTFVCCLFAAALST